MRKLEIVIIYVILAAILLFGLYTITFAKPSGSWTDPFRFLLGIMAIPFGFIGLVIQDNYNKPGTKKSE